MKLRELKKHRKKGKERIFKFMNQENMYIIFNNLKE